ncbi:MAG: AAA family ATPase [Bryobacterales bacterium]|nr:AAA family ATPase [Bryobacterales bacterium]
MSENFHGNRRVVAALDRMVESGRLPQAILLAGPEGVGKATLARRLAARLLGRRERIELDDLSLPANTAVIEEREKLPAEKRAEEPLFFASHPDFVTFPPDGPLRQITIQQMRLLRNRAQFKPQKGARRVFLIDHLDRANEQAANSLLKTLEEPPGHLTLVLTAGNAHDLLPTIRSRAVPFYLSPLDPEDMRRFVAERKLDHAGRRIAIAAGSPGVAVSLDLDLYDRRRDAMFSMLRAAAGVTGFSLWMDFSDGVAARRNEKLEDYLKVLYGLLEDLLAIHQGAGSVRNPELRGEMEQLAGRVSFDWIRRAVARTDELLMLSRRSIQKIIALDAWVLAMKEPSAHRVAEAGGV